MPRHILEGIRDINVTAIDALKWAAQDSSRFPLDPSLRLTIGSLGAGQTAAIANCGLLLIEIESWVSVKSLPKESHTSEPAAQWLPPAEARALAARVVLLAWHACQLSGSAGIVLGCSASAARRLCATPIVDLPVLVELAAAKLQIRWARRVGLWTRLLGAAAQSSKSRSMDIRVWALRCDTEERGNLK